MIAVVVLDERHGPRAIADLDTGLLGGGEQDVADGGALIPIAAARAERHDTESEQPAHRLGAGISEELRKLPIRAPLGHANEVVEAWRVIMPFRHRPAVLVLTRQNLPTLDRTKYAPASGLARGAYILADAEGGKPDVILIATGSEVAMTVEAYEQLTADGIRARVVSMPSMELFDKQPAEYRDEVLPPSVTARVAVEKGTPFGWDRWVGHTGAVIGMSTFGESAPPKSGVMPTP